MAFSIDSYTLSTMYNFCCCPSSAVMILVFNASPMSNIIHLAIFPVSIRLMQQIPAFTNIYELGYVIEPCKWETKTIRLNATKTAQVLEKILKEFIKNSSCHFQSMRSLIYWIHFAQIISKCFRTMHVCSI